MEIVRFAASGDDMDAVIGVLEDALAKAKAGKLKDIAVVGAQYRAYLER